MLMPEAFLALGAVLLAVANLGVVAIAIGKARRDDSIR